MSAQEQEQATRLPVTMEQYLRHEEKRLRGDDIAHDKWEYITEGELEDTYTYIQENWERLIREYKLYAGKKGRENLDKKEYIELFYQTAEFENNGVIKARIKDSHDDPDCRCETSDQYDQYCPLEGQDE